METTKTPLRHVLGYSLGDGAFSLTMNTIWGFSMFFYTQALGIPADVTGWILGIPMIWDAVTDPAMGFLSDKTKSRFGRRLPHILIGGVLLAFFYVFIWHVPDMFRKSQNMTVIYLIVVNMISRTLITWYYVPYVALGFEMSNDYNERNRLQSARYVCNMVFNLLFCGILVWHVFLIDANGNRNTTIEANYAKMGLGFGAMILLLVLTTVFSTRSYGTDTRQASAHIGNGIKGFCDDIAGIFKDRNAVHVFLFFCVVSCSFVFVGSTQMYVYVSFMDLSPTEASIVHSSTMIAFATGSLLATPIARVFDKKRATYIGSAINILGNALIGLVFLTGWMKPGMNPFTASIPVPFMETVNLETSAASVVFWLLQASYWLGSGMLLPIIFSMIADVSAINHAKTGQVKDGSYSAVSTFLMKVTGSIALIIVGKMLAYTGFVEGTDVQPPAVAFKLTQMMVFLGMFFTFVAVLFLIQYPITREYMEKLRNPQNPVPDQG